MLTSDLIIEKVLRDWKYETFEDFIKECPLEKCKVLIKQMIVAGMENAIRSSAICAKVELGGQENELHGYTIVNQNSILNLVKELR